MRHHQLTFDFAAAQSYQAADYVVTAANQEAVAFIDSWPRWPGPVAVIYGPAGVGKTHLLHLWQAKTQAKILPHDALNDQFDPYALREMSVAIDHADQIAGHADAERALLHLYNKAVQQKHYLLLAARTPPATWPVLIADLASRLKIASLIPVAEPDDQMMQALYHKLFHDRQLHVPVDVIEWLCARVERSAGVAQQVVVALDQAALAAQRPITIWLARKVLGLDEAEDDQV